MSGDLHGYLLDSPSCSSFVLSPVRRFFEYSPRDLLLIWLFFFSVFEKATSQLSLLMSRMCALFRRLIAGVANVRSGGGAGFF